MSYVNFPSHLLKLFIIVFLLLAPKTLVGVFAMCAYNHTNILATLALVFDWKFINAPFCCDNEHSYSWSLIRQANQTLLTILFAAKRTRRGLAAVTGTEDIAVFKRSFVSFAIDTRDMRESRIVSIVCNYVRK